MGTGGSTYGAGRPGWRRKCEHLVSLDIRQLHRRRLLRPGSIFGWYWNRDGEPSGNVSVRIEHESLTLNYQWTPSGGESVGRSTTFRLSQTNCYFGGVRSWLTCKWCCRRCAILYGVSGDGYFACRRCLKLGYSSEAEDAMDRLWRKQRKLEAKMGHSGEKPKWMRMRTYERIWAQIGEIEERKDVVCMTGLMRLMRLSGMALAEL
jgi:hypothetical protein